MSRMTLVFSLVATALAAGAMFYGTRLADELRDSNSRLQRGQERMSAAQAELTRELKELRLARVRRIRTPAGTPAVVTKGGGPTKGGGAVEAIDARLSALERGPGANNPLRNDLIARYRKLQEQAALDGGVGSEARAEALESVAELARWGDQEAMDIVLEALDDPQEVIREEAVDIVGKFGSPDLLPRLERAAADPSPAVREAAADSLQSMPAAQAGPILMRMLDDADQDVMLAAIETIGGIGFRPAQAKLTALLDHKDSDVVADVGRAMRLMGDSAGAARAIQRVAADMADPDPEKRIDGIQGLRTIGGPEVAKLVRKALADPDQTVRDVAERTLARLGYEE